MPSYLRNFATAACCLAAVACVACQQSVPVLETALYVNDTSAWYAAENDMTNFYHVTEMPEMRACYLNDLRKSPDASTRAFGKEREQIIREMDAAAALISSMSRTEKEAFAIIYLKEYIASLDKHLISDSAQLKDNNRNKNISNWDGMYTRTVERLPQEQQSILNTKGGARLMESYGGYMIARYVAFNPEIDASMRLKALFVIDLWNECSDGENGYRVRWIRRKHQTASDKKITL